MKMKTRILAALLALVLPALAGCGRATLTVETAPLAAEGRAAAHTEDPLPPSYDIYETFGLEYDKAEGALYFGGERVRYFFDGVDTGSGGQISRVEHIDRLGTVDVRTVRETVDNGDGSVNPFGPLTGLETASQAEFDARDIGALLHPSMEATTGCSQSGGEGGVSFTEIFAAYREFGVEFAESPEGSGAGNVYYLGELADAFADVSPGGGTFVFHSRDRGSCNVRTVYDGEGNLTGVERVTGGIDLG
ncbi:MAG: hypothetical protein OSJ58_12775 [Dysosmobacter sp.]|uniref:hypothetical protein n=1 Tax=uncultured Oscillibacter sp. TaxID=876091 RepID=UPI0026101813|nr:hypothetical protein [uncultured Oscillibacter sp.]MCX4372672.1 hypothetical protein [Dysosmobacter sp.]